MKIVEYNNIETLYSPINGELIVNEEELNHDATTLVGYWVDAAFDDPFLKNNKLKELWEKFESDYNQFEDNGWEKFEKFLSEIDENWICFRMTNYGMCCGPCSITTWNVLSLEK